jgi:ribose-phosphate pyrophosphokinase
MMGRGQAVRRGTLDPVFEGSNPSAPTSTSRGQLKLFSVSAHRALAGEIAEFLGVNIGQARLQRFPDTECSFQIDENIRGTDVFVVQPTCADVDRNLIELCVMIDAFRRSSASRITAVIPYYGYARQDRKDKPRVPISAKLVANLLSAAGANRVLTMDLHKAQIQGFFDIPVDHLFAAPVIIDFCDRLGIPDLTLVSPDAGGAERARAYAKRLDAELAIIDKRRSDDGSAEVMNVVGDVTGRTCIIQDDIIDTAGTIVKAAIALKENGAERVFACAVHGVLSGPAIERLEAAPIEQVIITNTIPLNTEKARCCKKIKQLSVARLLGQAIRSIHEETSVSSLFV